MKLQRMIIKYFEYGMTKLKVIKNQKHYVQDGIDLKYMYKESRQADTLAIVFSACTREGLAARYNYVKTLETVTCNQLFILDDFGPDQRGSYYLGRMPEFKEQEVTLSFIQKMIDEKKPKKIIFCGSCKGGYAALNFGSRFPNSIMIIGEPTYYIATEFELAPKLEQYWMGDINEENRKCIDHHLSKQLQNNPYIDSQKLELFYSTKDEYYERHTKPLVSDLREFGYHMKEEVAEFTSHGDLGLWFPGFLTKQLTVYRNQ